MQTLFQKVSSPWVRYSRYECKEADDGNLYITPVADAKPEVYDPLKNSEQMVLDALNVGALQMNRRGAHEVRQAIMDFVGRYGLLGFMTALPTTPSFMDYEAVYLPKNHFIREEAIYPLRTIWRCSSLLSSWIFKRREQNLNGTLRKIGQCWPWR